MVEVLDLRCYAAFATTFFHRLRDCLMPALGVVHAIYNFQGPALCALAQRASFVAFVPVLLALPHGHRATQISLPGLISQYADQWIIPRDGDTQPLSFTAVYVLHATWDRNLSGCLNPAVPADTQLDRLHLSAYDPGLDRDDPRRKYRSRDVAEHQYFLHRLLKLGLLRRDHLSTYIVLGALRLLRL
jgi:hypothetical protein